MYALWTFLAGDVSCDPLKRWGLIAPEPDDFLRVACVLSGYHAVRREFKRTSEFFSQDQNTLTGPQIRVAWTVYAETFQVEASQAKLHCRRFSVASFLNCMNHNAECAPCIADAGPDVT